MYDELGIICIFVPKIVKAMKQFLMSIAAVAVVLMMSACGGKTNKSASDSDSVPADSVEVQEASIDKHTEDYLRERVDSFYSVYKNPKYEKSGHRIYNGKFVNRDSAYCSKSYKDLMAKAEEIAEENEEPLLDYDHWTNSQDDNNFTYEVGKISNMTDSTAVVKVKAKNAGKPYTITLNMRFERGDWYVDDFISDDGTGEKKYFENYIKENNFYQYFSLKDLLYLTQHYDESAIAEKSGLALVHHNSEQSGEIDCEEYIYGRDIMFSSKNGSYDVTNVRPHGFYFVMSLDTSTNGFLYFMNMLDATDFYERALKTKPFTFENMHITVKKESNGKSFLVQEIMRDKTASTMFAVHSPERDGDHYKIYIEIYV